MDIVNLGANLSIVRDHLLSFSFLLFALPPFTFLSIKFWLTARAASKVQRTTQWSVPADLDSGGMRSLCETRQGSVASVHQLQPQTRDVAAMKDAVLKRTA
jgi:hypothetical protein